LLTQKGKKNTTDLTTAYIDRNITSILPSKLMRKSLIIMCYQ